MILPLLRHRMTLAWVVLVVATAVSWWLGADHGTGSAAGASTLILIVAFAKIRIVGLYFMELRDAPTTLRALLEAYCVGMCALLAALLLLHG